MERPELLARPRLARPLVVRPCDLGGVARAAALLALVAGAALATTACGGGYGGNNVMYGPTDSITQAEATVDGANAARLGSDTGLVADQTVQTLQAALGVGTGVGANLACPGGGSATIAVTGGSLATQTNGQLDAGEVYTLTLASCSAAVGAPAIAGDLTATVVAADANGATLTIATTTPLVAALPAGTVNLSGSFTLVRSVSGATTTSHVTATSLMLSRGASLRTFMLGAVDITLAVTRAAAGTVQALAYSGSHNVTVSQSIYSNLSYSVATTGSVSYDNNAQPITGNWTVTLPRQLLTLGLTTTTVHLTADFGRDGTIDLDTTFPRADLLAAVG